MSNKNVILSFNEGQERTSGNMRSTGNRLYSYNLCIAKRKEDGTVRVFNYTRSGEYISQTTSTHVGMTIRLVDNASLVNPKAV